MSNIRVAIADDHPMIITGIRDMLADAADISVMGAYLNGKDLLDGLQHNVPDVLILDIRLADYSGDELAPQVLKICPRLRILTLTNFDSILYVHTMLNAGAHGYLLKNTDKQTLVQAIKTLHAGAIFINTDMQAKLETFRRTLKRNVSSKNVLTPREKDILRLIACEYSNQQIAEKLCLSMRTVENYRLNIALKLEVKNTAGLVKKAMELGLILY